MKTFKKIIIAIALMACFVSCSNEQTPKVKSTEEIIENKQKIINATFEDGMEMIFIVSNDTPGEVTLQRCYSDSEHVIIPSQIRSNKTTYKTTSIGEEAFGGENLISITIPNCVKSIGKDAFSDCRSLTSVTIPGSVTSIGEGAFNECTSLTSVTIPRSVTSIGDYAFADCESLTHVKIQNPQLSSSLNYDLVFAGCEKLNPSNVK